MGRRGEPRVWLVSELYYPEETSTGLLMTQIAEALAEPFDMRVLCAQPTYASRGVRAPRSERVNGVSISRAPSTTFDKNRLLGRLINALSLTASIFLAAVIRFRRGDVALVVTNPPMLPFVIAVAARLRGAKCVLIVHDVYPDVAVALEAIPDGGAIERIAGAASRWLYRAVTAIVALSSDMAERIGRRSPDATDKITVIHHWADIDDIRPSESARKAFLGALDLDDRFVVQYAGNIGRTHGIEAIVEAAARLKDDRHVHFLVIGEGAKREWLVSAVDERGLDNVTVLPRQPREGLNDALNACDTGILAMVPGMLGISSPSRLYNVFASGKPVIAIVDARSHVADVIGSAGIGWVVEPGDMEQLEQTIRDAAAHPDSVRDMGRKARAVAEEQFSRDHITQEYVGLVRRLLAN
jgi:colanic acid biosynthesis glycosyl transferase WcaI